jgi:tellurite resistance protein TerA
MKYVWIFCWDYGKVQDGSAARFRDSDITLTITDDTGQMISVKVDTGDFGNVCCIATIDNSSPIGAKLINSSKTATLKGLKQLEQLLEVVK